LAVLHLKHDLLHLVRQLPQLLLLRLLLLHQLQLQLLVQVLHQESEVLLLEVLKL
jgi:hypothetical protein